MEQFNLDKWLKDKSRKVVTRDGREVRILCIDCGVRKSQPILVEITCSRDTKVLWYYNINGTTQDKNLNLFFTDEEEKLTDFESDLFTAFSDAWQQYLRGESVNVAEWAKEHSKELLESAKKELQQECDREATFKYHKELERKYDTGFCNGYDKGKQDALKSLPKDGDYDFLLKGLERELDEFFINRLAAYRSKASKKELDYQLGTYATWLKNLVKKDLPKWKKATENKEFDKHVLLFEDEKRVVLTTELYKGEYYIELSDLENLPKEE